MKYVLKTTYPCVAVVGNQTFDLDENDALEIEDEDRVLIYPNGKISFLINLLSPKENEFYSLFKRDDHTLIILEEQNRLQVQEKMRLNFGGKVCDVTVSSCGICFETSEKRIEYACPHSCKKPKIFKLKGYACVQFEQDLYAYSLKENRLSHFCGQLSLTADELSVSKQFFDSEKRVKNAKYKFGDTIVVQEENFVSEAKSVPDLAPYRLLESVRAKDYAHALSFLSERLKANVDADGLLEFFGTFTNFIPLSTTEFITLGKEKNFVKFSMENDKIDDISVDGL